MGKEASRDANFDFARGLFKGGEIHRRGFEAPGALDFEFGSQGGLPTRPISGEHSGWNLICGSGYGHPDQAPL